MISYSRSHCNIWKEKVLSYLQKLTMSASKSSPISLNVITTNLANVCVGVIKKKCDILNGNAPTGESRHLRAWCSKDDLVISIVAPSVLKRNDSMRCYV